jgi:hypothetical protein
VHALAEEMISGYVVKEAHRHTIWCTPTMGFRKAAARDLAALLVAARQPPIPKLDNENVFLLLHPSLPGPRVKAMPSTSTAFIFAPSRARLTANG